jgi:hypothetical protein
VSTVNNTYGELIVGCGFGVSKSSAKPLTDSQLKERCSKCIMGNSEKKNAEQTSLMIDGCVAKIIKERQE